ncbi:MAG: lysophospholipid acyltransferase family protein [Flavobacteriaceae bacterium]|nr:lysophospholipid acyltransferase family protein [Flavobacteriaceae bacterium]
MKKISKFILYNIMGWKIVGDFPKDIKKFIIVGAPHTSNYDFVVALLMKFIVDLDANFIAKHTLFKPPFGFIFKSLGGIPVDRSKSKNLVEAIIDIFNKNDKLILAMSPEGTRKKTVKWKTGFYHIAKGANVPIVFNTFDFGNKRYFISEPYYLTGDMEKDFLYFHNFYKDIKGKFPDQFEINFHKNMDK